MSAWCFLVGHLSDLFPNNPLRENVITRQRQCCQQLAEWVNMGDNSAPEQENEFAFEAKYVIAKICAIHDALRLNADFTDIANKLSRHLCDNRITKNGWGFTIDALSAHPVATCIVLRSLVGDQSARVHIISALVFLESAASELTGYLKLFVLNTIILCSGQLHTDGRRSALESARITIKELIQSSSSLPLHPTSTINVDYYDKSKIRYYRLQPDLIALETLALMSGDYRVYLKAFPGSTLFEHLRKTVDHFHSTFQDTYGGKLSFSTCLDIYRCLQVLNCHSEKNIPKLFAQIRTALAFSLGPSEDVVQLGVGTTALVVGFISSQGWLTGAGGGSLVAQAGKIIVRLFNLRKKRETTRL